LYCHLIAPIVIILWLLAADNMGDLIRNKNKENPDIFAMEDFPRCEKYKKTDTCVTIGYALQGPEEPWVNAAIKNLEDKYGLVNGTDGDI
jgi:hypothetical protein